METTQQKQQLVQLKKELNEEQVVFFNQLKAKIVEEAKKLIDESQIERFERYTEDNQVVRLLWAQNFKVEKAYQMWNKWIHWRIEIKADDIKEEDIASEYKSGKCFWHGKDKQNNPCLIVKVKNHVPGVSSDTMVKYVLFIVEEAIKKSEEAGTGMISIIWDREGFNRKNIDYRLFETFKKLNQFIQDNYAERIKIVYILYPNWFFKTIYAIVKPFLTERTKKKIVFVDKLEDLRTFFEPSELLIEHGGTSPYVFTYPHNLPPPSIMLSQVNQGQQTDKIDQDQEIIEDILLNNQDQSDVYLLQKLQNDSPKECQFHKEECSQKENQCQFNQNKLILDVNNSNEIYSESQVPCQ